MHVYIYIYMCVLSCVWLFATPRTVAHQAPLSMEFSRQEYWSGLPFPSPGDCPDPEIKTESPVSPTLAGGFFTTVPPKKRVCVHIPSSGFSVYFKSFYHGFFIPEFLYLVNFLIGWIYCQVMWLSHAESWLCVLQILSCLRDACLCLPTSTTSWPGLGSFPSGLTCLLSLREKCVASLISLPYK